MGRRLRAAAIGLGWGLAAGVAALVIGIAWVNLTAGGVEGSEAMGRAILVIVWLTPAAFVLGASAGVVAVLRAR